MSHLATQKLAIFSDINALRMACTHMGLKLDKRSTYSSYNGRIESGATWVISIADEVRKAALARQYGYAAHEIGVIADPDNPGMFKIAMDPYRSGMGICEITGYPVSEKGEILNLVPLLKQQYDMACDALAAAESGDTLTHIDAAQAHVLRPDLFPRALNLPSGTQVGIAETTGRCGV